MKYLLIILLLFGCCRSETPNEMPVLPIPNGRDFTVLINTKEGSCTGTLIKVANAIKILSAAHCASSEDQDIKITLENGMIHIVLVEKSDTNKDLLLLKGFGDKGLSIGTIASIHERIHSFQHGGEHASFLQYGELLETKEIMIGYETHETVTVSNMVTTYGSSGSGVLNDKEEVIGVVSAMDRKDIFSYIVPLDDLKEFLKP